MTGKNVQKRGVVIPAPVRLAQEVLGQLRAENPAAAAAVEKILPGYAMRLERAGQKITHADLLAAAQKGPAFLKEGRAFAPRKVIRDRTYEDVFKKLNKGDRYKGKNFGQQLVTAAAWGDLDHIKKLKKQGVDIHADYDSALLYAARFGHLKLVKYLHEDGGNVNTLDGDALKWAAEGGHDKIFRYLHRNGAHLKVEDPSLLGAIIVGKNLKVLKYARRQGLSLHSIDVDLYASCDIDTIKYIHHHGVDVRQNEDSLLCEALFIGNWDAAQYIIKYLLFVQKRMTPLSKGVSQALHLYQAQEQAWLKAVGIAPPHELSCFNPCYFQQELFQKLDSFRVSENMPVTNAFLYLIMAVFGSEQNLLQYFYQWGLPGPQPFTQLSRVLGNVAIQESQESIFWQLPPLETWRDAVLECGPSMFNLVRYAAYIPGPLKTEDGKKWSVEATRKAIAQVAILKSESNPALADFCIQHGLGQEMFDHACGLVKRVQNQNKKIPDFDIPGEQFDMKDGRFYRLNPDDFRSLFLGEMVDNCQSISSNAAQFVKYNFLSEDGGFYVVEKRGKVVGAVCAWRGKKDELCFDSLETLGDEVKPEQWEKILKAAAQQLTDNKKSANSTITRFLVGAGGETPLELKSVFKQVAHRAEMKDASKQYPDSKKQLLICKLK